MSRIILILSASLLLLNGCGRTVSSVDSAYLKPSTSSTLADKNRHDLLASSHLETGIQYIAPTPMGTPQPKKGPKASAKATSEAEITDEEATEASSEKKKLTENAPLTAAQREPAVRPKAMGFSLKDQKGVSSLIQFPKNKITVLAFADREGAAQMEKWIQPLYTKYTDQIDIHGIADLSAVPRFARGIAQSIVSGLVKYPVMLDWEGNISQAYKVEKAKTNLYVIDPQGEIHLHLSGPARVETLSEINLKIAELLD